MRRKYEQYNSSSKVYTNKRTKFSSQYKQIEEDVWIHVILSFVQPRDYLNLSLTSKTIQKCVKQNESYRFCYLLTGNHFPCYLIPSVSFLASSIPRALMKLPFRKDVFGILQGNIRMWLYKEDVARELMKLMSFNVKYAHECIDWFKQEASELIQLGKDIKSNKIDVRTVIPQLMKYESYLSKFQIQEFARKLKLNSARFIEEKDIDVLSCLIRMNPSIVFHSKTRQEIRNNRSLLLMAGKLDGSILMFASEELRRDKSLRNACLKYNYEYPPQGPEELRVDNLHVLEDYGFKTKYPQSGIHITSTKSLETIPDDFKSNRSVVLDIVSQNGMLLQYAALELQNDKELVLAAVSNSQYLNYAFKKWKDDYDVVCASIKYSGDTLQYASERLKDDLEIVKLAIKHKKVNLKYGSTRLRNNVEIYSDILDLQYCLEEIRRNKKLVLLAIRRNGMQLQYCSKELQNDEDVVFTAVSQHRQALQFASEEIRNNVDVVLRVIDFPSSLEPCSPIEFASERLKNSSFIVLYTLRQHPHNLKILEQVSTELLSNRDFVLKAVTFSGDVYSHLSESLLNDREIIQAGKYYNSNKLKSYFEKYSSDKQLFIECLAKDCRILAFASRELRNDKQVILAAVNSKLGRSRINLQQDYIDTNMKEDPEIYLKILKVYGDKAYKAKKLLTNKNFVLKAVTMHQNVFMIISETLKRDMDVIMTALNNTSLRLFCPELRGNKDVVYHAVRVKGNNLQYASSELRNTREIVEAAVTQSGDAILYASEQLRNDHDIVLLALKQGGRCVRYLSLESLLNRELMIEAVKQPACDFNFLPIEMRCDKEIALTAVQYNGYHIMYLPLDWVLTHRDVAYEAIKQNGRSIIYLPEAFRNDREFQIEAAKTYEEVLAISKNFEQTKYGILELAAKNGKILKWVYPEYQEDVDIVRLAVRQNSVSFQYAALKIRRDREYVLEMIKIHAEVFDYALIELKTDKIFIEQAMSTSEHAREYIMKAVSALEDVYGKIL
jgi:hypothetical protein